MKPPYLPFLKKAMTILLVPIILTLIPVKAEEKVTQAFTGVSSWYSKATNTPKGSTRTASGFPLDDDGLYAAHKTLPFGTRVRVTNLANDKSIIVTVIDRGPYIKGRVIDLTIGVARKLGFVDKGVQKVRVEVLTKRDIKVLQHPKVWRGYRAGG